MNQHISEKTSASGATPSIMFRDSSHGSVNADNSFITSKSGNDTSYEVSELGSPRHGKDKCSGRSMENSTSEHNLINSTQTHDRAASNKGFTKEDSSADKITTNTTDAIALRLDGTEFQPGTQKSKLNVHVKRLSTESIDSDFSSVQNSETSNSAANSLLQDASHHHESCEPSRNSLVTLPLYERHKLNRVLTTQQQRLVTAKTDVEDLLARLNQEMAARQYLMTKVSNIQYIFNGFPLF